MVPGATPVNDTGRSDRGTEGAGTMSCSTGWASGVPQEVDAFDLLARREGVEPPTF
jgi:hypothetical protein